VLYFQVSHIPTDNNGSMLGWYCFEGHFIRTLLVDAYKFNDDTWENIHFVQKVMFMIFLCCYVNSFKTKENGLHE
jgi:hypothetical protein